jgi:integrase
MPYKLVPPRPGRSPYFSVRGTHCGIYLDKTTGLADEAKARAVLRAWRDDAERGRLSRPGEPVFADAVAAYLETGGDPRYLGRYDPTTSTWSGITGRLLEVRLSEIDQARIDETAIALYPAASAATRNRHVYTPISAVLKHAGIDRKIRRPKGWRGRPRTDWMQPEQAFRLIGKAGAIDAELGIFLTLLLYTGMRLNEALKLTCDKLDLEEAWCFTPKTKNGDPRMVFLPPAAVAALANHPAGLARRGRVFRFNKNGRLYQLMAKAKAAAGVDVGFVTFHIFRHTWATWMRRYAGLDTTGLVATDAWRDRQSAARYEHVVVSEEARKAVLLPVESRKGRAK